VKIIYINTQNIIVAKDMLIKAAIEAGYQYVEMRREVIVEYDYLFRFVEKEEFHFIDPNLIDILNKNLTLNPYIYAIDESEIYFDKKDDFPKFKKNDYKLESRKVKNKIKTKITYNRRKY